MAVTDYRFPTNEFDVSSVWKNENYIRADDTSYASQEVGKNANGGVLRALNFGFTSDHIPSGATIDGIEVVISRYATTAEKINDALVQLRFNGELVGSNLASATYWPTGSPAEATYGGSTNKWGTSLTQANITIDGENGFSISINQHNGDTSTNISAAVDYIKIRVYYTEGGGATVKPHYYYLQQ